MYHPVSDQCDVVISATLNRISAVRDFVTRQTMFTFFFFAMQCPRQHVTAKNGIPDQTDGIYTLFQTKIAKSIPYFRLEMLENGTLWGGTYLYGLYIWEYPPGKKPKPQRNPDSRLIVVNNGICGKDTYLRKPTYNFSRGRKYTLSVRGIDFFSRISNVHRGSFFP